MNLVEDYGADPTGEEPIGPALSQAWGNDTLIVVPEGLYTMNQGFRRTNSANVELIGQNAVIRHGRVDAINGHVVTAGEYEGGTMLFRIGTPSAPHQGEFVFGGFIFDWDWHGGSSPGSSVPDSLASLTPVGAKASSQITLTVAGNASTIANCFSVHDICMVRASTVAVLLGIVFVILPIPPIGLILGGILILAGIALRVFRNS